MVGRSVGRSRFYFSGGAGPAAGGEGAGPAAAAGTESPGPRPRTPATGCRGQAVGRSARWQEDGTVPADLPARIFLQWVMTRRGPRAERYRRGPHTPRPAKSVSHVSPSRTICSYCPDDLAGPVGLRPDRGRERPRPESCPAQASPPDACRTIFAADRRPGGPLRGPFRQGPARPPRPLLCCLLPASGLRWAGRSYPPPDRPFSLGRRTKPFKMPKTFFLTSFLHHSDPIFSQ